MPSVSELVGLMLSIIPVWLALILFLPKRDWRTLIGRLRDTANGRRHHPFGPPLKPGGGSCGFWGRLAACGIRCLELGGPLWLATVWSESQGRMRRIEQASRWDQSPTGWMWRHLKGELSATDLTKLLTEHDQPLPAEKARLKFTKGFVLPPVAWFKEQKPAAVEKEPAPSPSENTTAVNLAELSGRLRIRTLGRLQVTASDGSDLTHELRRRPTVSYIWQYLLVRAILAPDRPVVRSGMADELNPGLNTPEQLGRLRRRLHDLQQKLPAELSEPVVISEHDLRFNTDSCRVDVVDLLNLSQQMENGSGSSVEAGRRQITEAAPSQFLPDWEELEQVVTGGRGTGGDSVEAVRNQIQKIYTKLPLGPIP